MCLGLGRGLLAGARGSIDFLFAAVCCRPRTSAPDLMARPAGHKWMGEGVNSHGRWMRG